MLGRKKKAEKFAAEVLEHLDVLYSTALRLCRNRPDAEDLAHDTCLRAVRFQERFQPGTNLRAWLMRIMLNLFINQYRRQRRGSEIAQGAEREALLERAYAEEKLSASERPEEFFFETLFSEEVVKALEELPLEFRLVILLVDVNEFSYAQAAEILEIPMGTVMSRLHRGRRLLRARLYGFALEEGYLRSPSGGAELASLEEYRRHREAKR